MTDPSDQTSRSGSSPRPTPNFGGQRWSATFSRVNRTYTAWRASPSWLQKAFGAVALVILVGLAAILLVVGLAVGAVIALVVGAVIALRLAWARLTGGPRTTTNTSEATLDPLRQNVRVIQRHTTDTPP